ncbi:MAG: nitroreductase family protein [Thermodesulfobacteriota bacterium]
MDFATLVRSSRTVRRFKESEPVDAAALEWLVDLARFCPSAGNFQPLKFVLVNDPAVRERIFPSLAWAGYLSEWPGPVPGERPAAYIAVLHDKRVAEKVDCDHGIMAQTIMLGAASRGLGGCILGAVDRKALAQTLDLPEHLAVLLVLALGRPAETVAVEDVDEPTDRTAIRYWRDDAQVHHVPKRTLNHLIHARYVDHG